MNTIDRVRSTSITPVVRRNWERAVAEGKRRVDDITSGDGALVRAVRRGLDITQPTQVARSDAVAPQKARSVAVIDRPTPAPAPSPAAATIGTLRTKTGAKLHIEGAGGGPLCSTAASAWVREVQPAAILDAENERFCRRCVGLNAV